MKGLNQGQRRRAVEVYEHTDTTRTMKGKA